MCQSFAELAQRHAALCEMKTEEIGGVGKYTPLCWKLYAKWSCAASVNAPCACVYVRIRNEILNEVTLTLDVLNS